MVCRELIFWQALSQGIKGYAQEILAGVFLLSRQEAWCKGLNFENYDQKCQKVIKKYFYNINTVDLLKKQHGRCFTTKNPLKLRLFLTVSVHNRMTSSL